MTSYVAIADSDIDPESPITTTLMTRLRDNAVAIGEADLTVPSSLSYGKLIAFHTITASNAVWAPNAKTKKLIVQCIGGGGGGAGSNSFNNYTSYGGQASLGFNIGVINNPTGTYSVIVGVGGNGGAGVTSSSLPGFGAKGGDSSFGGIAIARGGLGGIASTGYIASPFNGDNPMNGQNGIGGPGGLYVSSTGANGTSAAAFTFAGGGAGSSGYTGLPSPPIGGSGGSGSQGIVYIWEYT